MVFSTPAFLFLCLPLFLAAYALCPARWRNACTLVASLILYATGPGAYVPLLLFYIVWNWAFGNALARVQGPRATFLLLAGLAGDIGGLLYYKYLDALLALLGAIGGHGGGLVAHADAVKAIPLGISFFSFQAISYLVDVHRRTVAPSSSLVDFATYKAFFPQLIAGPIVRYAELKNDIRNRPLNMANAFEGMVRLSQGLAKKTLLADPLATVANDILSTSPHELSSALVWIAMLAYTFQIYFDFSGYSDMAIGMARMLGFHFPENFDLPYSAKSITEFWRRWHMTLSRWFRDYLYIPLGGNRQGRARTARNLLVVFTLCGLWHGAGLQFVAWGLYHGTLLSLERLTRFHQRAFGRIEAGLRQLLTFGLVVIGWVVFRADSLPKALEYLSFMAFVHPAGTPIKGVHFYLTPDKLVLFAVAILLSMGLLPPLGLARRPAALAAARGLAAIGLLILSASAMSASQFSPFIYFQF